MAKQSRRLENLLVEIMECIQYDAPQIPECGNGKDCDHCQRWREMYQRVVKEVRRIRRKRGVKEHWQP